MPVTREWPVPPGGSTLHLIGDLHFGAVTAARTDKVKADYTNRLAPVPAAHFQVGDLTDDGNGGGTSDTAALAWLAGITGAPVYVACGNHDIWQNVRTVAAWQTAYSAYLHGSGSKNYVVDFPLIPLRVIVVGPDTMNYPTDNVTIQLTAATLTWLDARLAETVNDCWIICHAPLYNTCLGGASYFQSVDAGFFVVGPNTATDSSDITALLGAHANAKAWLSGHTHSDITVPGFATLTTCGARQVAAINASAIFYTGQTVESTDPLYGIYVTRTVTGSLQVRYRNHGGVDWDCPATARVTTLTPS